MISKDLRITTISPFISTTERSANNDKLTKKLELNFFRAGFPLCRGQFWVGLMRNWTMMSS